MKQNLIVLCVILALGSIFPRLVLPFNVCGVRPGMTRAEIERLLEVRSEEGGLLEGPSPDGLYHMKHSLDGCHCGCPRVRVTYLDDVALSVTGHELRQGWWVLARPGDALPAGLPWILSETRAELPAEHLSVRTDSDASQGTRAFREATLTR